MTKVLHLCQNLELLRVEMRPKLWNVVIFPFGQLMTVLLDTTHSVLLFVCTRVTPSKLGLSRIPFEFTVVYCI